MSNVEVVFILRRSILWDTWCYSMIKPCTSIDYWMLLDLEALWRGALLIK